ncbi:tectonin domain-containing protein, partial [Streptomyces sp. NPDC056237]
MGHRSRDEQHEQVVPHGRPSHSGPAAGRYLNRFFRLFRDRCSGWDGAGGESDAATCEARTPVEAPHCAPASLTHADFCATRVWRGAGRGRWWCRPERDAEGFEPVPGVERIEVVNRPPFRASCGLRRFRPPECVECGPPPTYSKGVRLSKRRFLDDLSSQSIYLVVWTALSGSKFPLQRSRRRDTNMADWKQVSGGLTTISVGSRTHVWGVNSLGQMYRYTGHDSNPWVG